MKTFSHKNFFYTAFASVALVAAATGCSSAVAPSQSADQSGGTTATTTSTGTATTPDTGTSTTPTAPVTVAAPWSSARIAAGDYHTCLIDSNDGVLCWGGGGAGQLGNGASQDSSTYVQVSNLTSGVQAIAAGGNHTCALTIAGAVYCWGSNAYGQIGDGTTTYRNVPTPVSGLGSGVVALAAGNVHTCAITSTGAMYCWGDNTYGQLGIGSTTGSPTPVMLDFFPGSTGLPLAPFTNLNFTGQSASTGNDRSAAAIALGYHHSCATDSTGVLYCWGYNIDGRVGDGTTTQRNSPVTVQTLTSGVQSISAGYYHTCAVDSQDLVWCWGNNTYGQLGQGGGSASTTPLQLTSLTMSVQNLVAGAYHSCVTDGNDTISCWGNNSYGQLGTGSTSSAVLSPVTTTGITGSVRGLATGAFHSCSLDGAGVQCWGSDYYGQLGDGYTQTTEDSPVSVLGITPAL